MDPKDNGIIDARRLLFLFLKSNAQRHTSDFSVKYFATQFRRCFAILTPVARLLTDLLHNSFVGFINMENKSETPDQSQIVQYLNYKRMGHGCLQAAAQVSNVGNGLVFLDLSGNRLGDEGICNLAKILRINRTIKAISLSNNCLSDIGIEALCEVLCCINFKLHSSN